MNPPPPRTHNLKEQSLFSYRGGAHGYPRTAPRVAETARLIQEFLGLEGIGRHTRYIAPGVPNVKVETRNRKTRFLTIMVLARAPHAREFFT
jgi:hypothetical protein